MPHVLIGTFRIIVEDGEEEEKLQHLTVCKHMAKAVHAGVAAGLVQHELEEAAVLGMAWCGFTVPDDDPFADDDAVVSARVIVAKSADGRTHVRKSMDDPEVLDHRERA